MLPQGGSFVGSPFGAISLYIGQIQMRSPNGLVGSPNVLEGSPIGLKGSPNGLEMKARMRQAGAWRGGINREG